MENNFYTDNDFEHFLKDATDDFKMYPSKRVWYSIYNDQHPSRRWPSLAICLLLITAILFVGISNNNSINKSVSTAFSNTLLTKENIALASNDIANQQKNKQGFAAFNIIGKTKAEKSITVTQDEKISVAEDQATIKITSPESVSINTALTEEEIMADNIEENNITKTAATKVNARVKNSSASTTGNSLANNRSDNVPFDEVSDNKKKSEVTAAKKFVTPTITLSKEDKAWIEDYAFQNRSAKSKVKLFGSMQYYATASYGFRFLKNTSGFDTYSNSARQSAVVSNNNIAPEQDIPINDQVTQKSSLGLEVGAAFLYSVSKKIRIKTGLQFNYTNYISIADGLGHPIQTSLLLSSGKGYAPVSRSSNYSNSSNGEKNHRLNNSTYQVSIPVGADIKLAGRNRLKWYAGATVQPTFVTGGSVFVISADTKNYVEDKTLLRKWNMNTAIETFLSYKTGAGVTVNVGPQIRYQLYSTYGKQYNYSEKLYNVGLKLGVTKSF